MAQVQGDARVQGRPCAPRRPGAAVVEHNERAVWKASRSPGELIRRDPDRPWKRVGNGGHLVGSPHIEDDGGVPRVEPSLEFVGADSRRPERLQDAVPAGPPDRQIEKECRDAEAEEGDPEVRCDRGGTIEKIAEGHPSASPGQGAHGPVRDEAREAQAGRFIETRDDGTQFRQEPGTELTCPSVPQQDVLGTTNVSPRLGGNPTKHVKRPCPAPAAKAVPAEVRNECRADAYRQDHGDPQTAAACQCSRSEQGWHHRHGNAGLVGQDPGEEDPTRVFRDHACHRGPPPGPIARPQGTSIRHPASVFRTRSGLPRSHHVRPGTSKTARG